MINQKLMMVAPTSGPAPPLWTVYFDNSDWAPAPPGEWPWPCVWNVDHWEATQATGGPYSGIWFVTIDDIGTWADTYRPIKIRVTISISPVSNAQLYDTDDGFGTPSIMDESPYSSLSEIILSWDGLNDLKRLVIAHATNSFNVTNIEFLSEAGPGLWAWGGNERGQLGLGDIADRATLVQIGALTTWSILAPGGRSSLVIKTDGTLWAWGYNRYGQLGLGDETHRSSPVQVGSLTDWVEVTKTDSHSLAIKTDGTLWSWGLNDNSVFMRNGGQLGLGDGINRSSPTQVGALTDWSKTAGGNHSLAVKTDGTLWSWGNNDAGQLGQGDTVDRSSPVQVGSLTTWSEIDGREADTSSNSASIKTDGTLWTWGRNSSGQLGLGDINDRSSLVQVGALTNWSKLSCGDGFMTAIKTDGTLWTWGTNLGGELGQGDNGTKRSSPVQVGSLTDWDKISCGGHFTLAIKTDGTLWMWGNIMSEVGDSKSSPVQVGSLTTWNSIDAGNQFILGIIQS